MSDIKPREGAQHALLRSPVFCDCTDSRGIGFGGIAAGAVEIAKILFFVFLVITVITLIIGVIKR